MVRRDRVKIFDSRDGLWLDGKEVVESRGGGACGLNDHMEQLRPR